MFLSNQLCYNFLSKLQTLNFFFYDCTASRTTGRVRQQPGFRIIELSQRIILAFSCSDRGLLEVMMSREKDLDFPPEEKSVSGKCHLKSQGRPKFLQRGDNERSPFGTDNSSGLQAALSVVF